MNQIKPRFVAAECVADCQDRRCPYSHVSGWRVPQVLCLFVSERAANDFLEQIRPYGAGDTLGD